MPWTGAVCTCGGATSASWKADDDDRNAKQAREAWYGALVESGRMPAANIHAMPADTRGAEEIAAASPEQTDAVLAEAAAEYQRELIEQLGENPALDIAMFGMGRTRISRPCSPTTARPKSTTRTCWRRRARFAETAAAAPDIDRADDRPVEAYVGVHLRRA
mgnify:CR=1 FL=1